MVFNDIIFFRKLSFSFIYFNVRYNECLQNELNDYVDEKNRMHTVRHNCVQFIALLNINSKQSCVCSYSYSYMHSIIFMPDAFHVKIYLLFISLAIDSGQLCSPSLSLSRSFYQLQFYLLEPPQSSPLCAMRLFIWLMIICLSLNSINTLQITCIQTCRHARSHTQSQKYPYLDGIHIILQFCRVKCGHTTAASVCVSVCVFYESSHSLRFWTIWTRHK